MQSEELEERQVVLITITAVNGAKGVIKGDWRGCNERAGCDCYVLNLT